jgi:hypothetical protein
MLEDKDNSKINVLTGLLKVQKDAPVNASISQSFASGAVLDHLWRGKKKPPFNTACPSLKGSTKSCSL